MNCLIFKRWGQALDVSILLQAKPILERAWKEPGKSQESMKNANYEPVLKLEPSNDKLRDLYTYFDSFHNNKKPRLIISSYS